MRAIDIENVVVALALLAGGAQPARTEPSLSAAKGVRLEVHRGPGAETCPDDASLRAGIAAALGYDPFSEPVDRVFVAVIDGAGGRYSATVSAQDPEGRPLGMQQLKYRLASCDELAAAIELAIALAIDPTATAPPPAVAGGAIIAKSTPTASPPAAPTAPRPADAGPRVEVPAVLSATNQQASPSPIETVTANAHATEESRHLDWRVTAGAGVAFRAAPTTVPALSAGAELRFPRYSFGLELRGDLASHASAAGGSYRTSLVIATLVPCYRWGLIGACGLIGAGAQLSAGTGLDPSLTVTTPYFALGARASADFALTAWLWLRPQLDLWVPIARTTLIVAEE